MQVLRDKVFERPAVEELTIAHGMAPDVDEMRDLLSPRYPAGQIRVTMIGATIGTHAGPRVMGLHLAGSRLMEALECAPPGVVAASG